MSPERNLPSQEAGFVPKWETAGNLLPESYFLNAAEGESQVPPVA